MTWHEQMVQLLLEQRRQGVTEFGLAWRRASAVCPRPRDWYMRGHEMDDGWLPFSTFFRQACKAEWNGLVDVDYLGLREMLEASSLSTNARAQRQGTGGRSRVVMIV